MGADLLVVTELHAYYGKSHALRGVSLRVGRGEIVGILGRNGVGKTTTLRAILNLVPLRRGGIRFEGEEVSRLSTDALARRGVGYVPQGLKVFPRLTVRENLEIARSTSPRARPLAELLERFPVLAPLLDRPAGTLSGGQQQLLAIARGLLMNAQQLLLDEPTDGLMPKLVHELRELLPALTSTGLAILLVEQNLDLALAVCRRLYLMEKGQIGHEADAVTLQREPRIVERYLGVGAS